MSMTDLLKTYLQDHHAGATAGLELARRTAGANEDTPYGDELGLIADEIAEDREALEQIMERLGISESRRVRGLGSNQIASLEREFGGMLRALRFGAPPHGGIAPGIDRIVMLLCGEQNLREVVLYPMNQRAEDLMMGAPSDVTPKQLRELHIRLNLPST